MFTEEAGKHKDDTACCISEFDAETVRRVLNEDAVRLAPKARFFDIARDMDLEYKLSLVVYNTKLKNGTDRKNTLFDVRHDLEHNIDLRASYGMAIDDYDGDGYVDAFICNWYYGNLYRNNGDMTFTKVPGPWNEHGAASGARFADLTGDGRKELIVIRKTNKAYFQVYAMVGEGWEEITGRHFDDTANELLASTDRQASNYWASMMETPVVLDSDNDGLADLAIQGYPLRHRHQHRLYRQRPGGTFHNVVDTSFQGLARDICGEGAAAVDMDMDGDVDLFIYGNLYENVDGVFLLRPLPEAVGVDAPFRHTNEEGVAVFDMDNDGDFDILLCAETGAVLYEQTSPWRFSIFRRFRSHVSASAFDFDMDGDVDIFLGGTGRYERYPMQSQGEYYMNTGGDFVPMTLEAGLVTDYFTYTSAAGDFDNDGDYDLLTGFVKISRPEFESKGILFENKANPENYMVLDLLGPAGTRNQFGAVVQVRDDTADSFAALRFINGGHGYLGQDDSRIIIATAAGHEYSVTVTFPRHPDYDFHVVDARTTDKLKGIVPSGSFAQRTVQVHRDGRVVIGAAR